MMTRKETSDKKLVLATWNVALLNKKFILAPKTPTRQMLASARAMGRMLSKKNYTIVGLNEGFVLQAVNELVENATDQSSLKLIAKSRPPRPKDAPWTRPLSGGLVLLASRELTVTEQDSEPWRKATDALFRGTTLDARAYKGVYYSRLRMGELYINIFLVHLNASHYAGAREIRRQQLRQLKKFISKKASVAKAGPTFVIGDFNVRGKYLDPEDEFVFDERIPESLESDLLGAPVDAYLAQWPDANCHGLRNRGRTTEIARVDYIFFYPEAGPWRTRYVRGSYAVDPMELSPGNWSSDHLAVAAEFTFEPRR